MSASRLTRALRARNAATAGLLVILAVILAQPAGAQETQRVTTKVSVQAGHDANLLEARDAVWRAYFSGDSARLAALLPEEVIAIGWDSGDWGGREEVIAGAQGF